MNINELVKESHGMAVEKGWWETNRSLPETLFMVVSELAEALEQDRKGKPYVYQVSKNNTYVFPNNETWEKNVKPEGILIELADAIIRIADICGKNNFDLESAIKLKLEYNKTRERRHGNLPY